MDLIGPCIDEPVREGLFTTICVHVAQELPKLSIIIVNWNSTEFLVSCLDSLYRDGIPEPYEIIVVDNGSVDGSVPGIEGFPGVVLLRNRENVGFARANNQAMEKAKGEYLLLLNPDTLVREGRTLRRWIEFMDRCPEAGASGCKLVYADGSHQVGDGGFRPTLVSVFNYAFLLSHIFPSLCKSLYLTERKAQGEVEVDWVCGADLLVRRSILAGTGLLDETIFMYAEDVEFGCRVRSLGHRICYLPYLEIVHFQGGSAKKAGVPGMISVSWLENTRRLYRLFNKGCPVLWYDLTMTGAFLLRTVYYTVKYLLTRKDEVREKARRMWAFCFCSAGYMVGH